MNVSNLLIQYGQDPDQVITLPSVPVGLQVRQLREQIVDRLGQHFNTVPLMIASSSGQGLEELLEDDTLDEHILNHPGGPTTILAFSKLRPAYTRQRSSTITAPAPIIGAVEHATAPATATTATATTATTTTTTNVTTALTPTVLGFVEHDEDHRNHSNNSSSTITTNNNHTQDDPSDEDDNRTVVQRYYFEQQPARFYRDDFYDQLPRGASYGNADYDPDETDSKHSVDAVRGLSSSLPDDFGGDDIYFIGNDQDIDEYYRNSYNDLAILAEDVDTNINNYSSRRRKEVELLRKKQRGTFMSSMFSLTNSAMGTGLLALPFAFRESGAVLGVVLLIVTSMINFYSLLLLVASAKACQKSSYEDVAKAAFGRVGTVIVYLVIAIGCIGVMCAYMIVIGDVVPPVLQLIATRITNHPLPAAHAFLLQRDFLIGIVVLCIITPLCLLGKRMHRLRFTSLLAILSIAYLMAAILARSIQHMIALSKQGHSLLGPIIVTRSDSEINIIFGEYTFASLGIGVAQTVSILAFALGCHLQVLPIYGELREKRMIVSILSMRNNAYGGTDVETEKVRRMYRAIFTANAIVTVLYMFIGAGGYFSFADATQGNILNNYKDSDVIMVVARAMLVLSVCFTFPLVMYPCRFTINHFCSDIASLLSSLMKARRRPRRRTGTGPATPLIPTPVVPGAPATTEGSGSGGTTATTTTTTKWSQALGAIGFVVETILIIGICYAIATLVPRITTIFTLSGSIGSMLSNHILPCLFYLKLVVFSGGNSSSSASSSTLFVKKGAMAAAAAAVGMRSGGRPQPRPRRRQSNFSVRCMLTQILPVAMVILYGIAVGCLGTWASIESIHHQHH